MAKATKIPVPPVPPSIQLELTPKEAQFLADILSMIGGDPVRSRRKYSDSISSALCTVDVKYSLVNYDEDVEPDSKHIWFLNRG